MRSLRIAWLVCLPLLLSAQPTDPINSLRFRQIGPFRGGRSVAVAGVPSQPDTFYFGAVGGGVFKTTDSGVNWLPVSDGQLKTGSVGALAVADSDPNVIYAGMGEACVRGNATHGDGVYKSVDAGHTWRNVGLQESYHIGAVVVDPKDANLVYVAAVGHLWGPNEMRGVYRSSDGGTTWKQVLKRTSTAGAVDLAMDPSNPRVLYAATWEISRKPWRMDSGGPGSGIFKSTDGGDTWSEISRAPGLPKGVLGKIGLAISPVNPEHIWAMVEAADGGLFRSDNGGRNWTRVNEAANLRQRAWYYTHIYADPKNVDTVYALNVGMFKSIDGGRTFNPIGTPHSDNHDLWIAPADPKTMIEANDGGAAVTHDGGRTWSTLDNQPTAQFYRVTLDQDFPYHIYGAQQDNSTVRIASRTTGSAITSDDWYDVGGGESGWIAPDPRNSQIVYAGSYDGLLTRQDKRTGQSRNINPWPDNPMGYGVEAMKYRFQWSFPIAFSLHDPKVLYAGSQMLLRTLNEGQNWEALSPDLTRNDKSKMGSSGGPITQDNTSVEYYGTIFTLMESPVTKGVIWTGSDDGLVYVTRDGGKNWTNVTPPGMPEWIRINSIDASSHDAGTAYVAATNYQQDDFRPYLYKTADFGKTWKKIVNGIAESAFTRVVREDPNRKGLLVAGTETGLYLSFDDGGNWRSFQLNLPVTPITDLQFHKREKELVIGTEGRSFWVLDDVGMLYQLNGFHAETEEAKLFQPRDTYRFGAGGRGGRGGGAAGENPPGGVVVQFYLKANPQGTVTLDLLDSAGKPVNQFSTAEAPRPQTASGDDDDEAPRAAPAARLNAQQGMNRYVWNLRYPDATVFPGMILWAGSTAGPRVPPGKYSVRLTVDGKTQTQTFEVKKDPRLDTTADEYARQLSLSLQVRDKLSETNDAVIRIRELRKQLDEYAKRDSKNVAEAAKALRQKLTEVEEALYQTKLRSSQDPLNFPIKLNNKLAHVLSVVQSSDNQPTQQAYMVYEDLATQVNAQLKKLDALLGAELAAFNRLVRDENVPAVVAPPKKAAQ
ncbi:MAG: glycosyl hydrolase [Candidatus Solibacter sp.]